VKQASVELPGVFPATLMRRLLRQPFPRSHKQLLFKELAFLQVRFPTWRGYVGAGGPFMGESGSDSFGVFQRLNPRQKRCAALLVSGYSSNVAIAKRLGITPSAVANNISLIMDACGVFSRLNLALFIVRTPGLGQKLLEFEERVQRCRDGNIHH
jgi:DNA-binding CsgD family transcriptional regulator